MSIRERRSKSTKTGIVYEVVVSYKDEYNTTRRYTKSGFKTKKEARDHEAEMIVYLKTGQYTKQKQVTFNQAFEEYMMLDPKKYALATKKNYEYAFNQHVQKSIGNRLIRTLKFKDLQSFLDEINTTYFNKQIILKVLRNGFEYALKNDYIEYNPMVLVKLQKVEDEDECEDSIIDEEDEVITEEELQLIINELLNTSKHSPNSSRTNWTGQSFSIGIMCGYYSGLRISEVLALRKEDIDFEKNSISIRRRLQYHGIKKNDLHTVKKLKTKKSKATIPLASELKRVLLEWYKINPYDLVVPDIDGSLLLPQTYQARIRSVAKRIGINFHFHTLRHTLCSNLLLNQTVDIVVRDILRHSQVNTSVNRYGHSTQMDQALALDKLFGNGSKIVSE